MAENPSEFFARVKVIAAHFGTTNPAALLVGLGSLALILFVPKLFPRVPGSIVALLAATLVAAVFHLPAETIGSKFGGISRALPPIHIPQFRADLILPLLPSALTVAILAALESLLSAVVADSMSGESPQFQRRVSRPRVCQYREPFVRRHSRDRRDRAYNY